MLPGDKLANFSLSVRDNCQTEETKFEENVEKNSNEKMTAVPLLS